MIIKGSTTSSLSISSMQLVLALVTSSKQLDISFLLENNDDDWKKRACSHSFAFAEFAPHQSTGLHVET